MAKKKTEHVEEAEVKVEAEKVEAPKKAEPKKAEEELVTVFVPYIPGDDPEVTVIINGYITKFRKGETVQVKKNVAEVLENANQMAKVAQKNKEKFREQVREL